MNKFALGFWGAILLSVAVILFVFKNNRKSADLFFSANIDALADEEIKPLELCDQYCVYSISKECTAITNYGFPIRCTDMKNWPDF